MVRRMSLYREAIYGKPEGVCNKVDMQEFETAQEMVDSGCLKAGYAHTLGFYEVGDGGEAWYRVVANPTGDKPNGMDVLKCRRYVAELLVPKMLSPEQLGGGRGEDDTEVLQRAVDLSGSIGAWVFLSNKTYYIEQPIVLANFCKITGTSKTSSIIKTNDQNGRALISGFDDVTGTRYNLTVGCVIENIGISGNYNLTNLLISDRDGAISGCFIGCVIEHIVIRNVPRGFRTFHAFNNVADYNFYNATYGDERIFNDISCMHVYQGFMCRQADCDYTNLRCGECYDVPGNFALCTLTNYHCWTFGNSNVFDCVRASNVEIEAPYWYQNIPISAIEFRQRSLVSNLYIWQFYKPDNYQYTTNYGPVLKTTSTADVTIISSFEFGSNDINESSREIKSYIADTQIAGSGFIINALQITYNLNSASVDNLFNGNVIVNPYSVSQIKNSDGTSLARNGMATPRWVSLDQNSKPYQTINKFSFSQNTGDYGNIFIGNLFDGHALYAESEGAICYVFSNNNRQFVKLLDYSTMQPVVNTNASVTVYYI